MLGKVWKEGVVLLVRVYPNIKEYLTLYEGLMLQQEAISQLILYNLYQSLEHNLKDCIFGAVLEDDNIVFLFCNYKPYNLTIYIVDTEKTHEAAVVLADYISHKEIEINGILARQDVCLTFMEQYKKTVDCTFLEKIGMDIMEIRQISDLKPPIEGSYRLALPEEVKLVTEWMIEYQIETLDSETDYEAALKKATELINKNRVFLFEIENEEIVSLVIALRKLPHGMALGYVYTPEEHRGKSYAVANLYYVSKYYLENGFEFCTLFVDKKNPIASRAYEKIGFKILENNYEYTIIKHSEEI